MQKPRLRKVKKPAWHHTADMQTSVNKTEMHLSPKHTIFSLLQPCYCWKPCARNPCLPCLHCLLGGHVFEEDPHPVCWGWDLTHFCPSWICQWWRLTLAPWQARTALSLMLLVREAKLLLTHKQVKDFTVCILNWPHICSMLSLLFFVFLLSQLFLICILQMFVRYLKVYLE